MSQVCVLLPVYNAESTLAESLESLRRQNMEDFEVLLVDDGCTDGSSAILAEYGRRDPRFRVLPRPHEGLVPALNGGLAGIGAPLVARMDADDVARPDRLARQVAYLQEHPETDLVASHYDILSDSPPAEGSLAYQSWQNALLTDEDIRRNLFVESPFAHPTVMFRRHAVAALGGYRDMGWPEDYDLWLRMARAGCRFARIPEPLVQWRDRPGRLTWTDSRYSLEAFARCKAHHLARGPLAGRGAVAIAGAGIAGGRIGRALLAEAVEIDFFLDVDPRKIGGEKRGRPVWDWEEGLPLLAGRMLLVAVGARGRRDDIRADLGARGFLEGEDYLCVA